MDLMEQLGGILKQYTGAGAAQPPASVDDDFDQVAQSVPTRSLSEGLAEAFRSDQTPPFPQMAANMFGSANGQQKAGILNTLISTLGPALVAQILGGKGGGGGSILGNIFNSGRKEVTPEEAEQVSPEVTKELAERAEKEDSSIIDKVSDFYAEHPTLVKTLGGAALTMVLARIANRNS